MSVLWTFPLPIYKVKRTEQKKLIQPYFFSVGIPIPIDYYALIILPVSFLYLTYSEMEQIENDRYMASTRRIQ
jgi:hypothetical protein